MIRLGDTPLAAAYVGDTPLARAYVGDAGVWERGRPYLTFSSPGAFTLATKNGAVNWDGILEYSTDAETWTEWDGTEIASGSGNVLYLRGTGNTELNLTSTYTEGLVLDGSEISCTGNIETLLDWETVAAGQHPQMGDYAFMGLFYGCTALVSPPSLLMPELSAYGCESMFEDCTGLRELPEIHAASFGMAACYGMFLRCAGIRVSETQGGAYTTPYRVPVSGTGVDHDTLHLTFARMFEGTGGSYTGDGEVNRTYYLSNETV